MTHADISAFRSHLCNDFHIEIRDPLYTRSASFAYKCFDLSLQRSCVVKAKKAIGEKSDSELEAETMQKIDHSNVLKASNWTWLATASGDFFILFLDYCEMDLCMEIRNRKLHNHPWTEKELWEFLSLLIRALSDMQGLNIAHRRIRPQHIYLTPHKTPKIGDFHSKNEAETELLESDAAFLSPKLLQMWANSEQSVSHNVFKSDVYALGATLYSMASLQVPARRGDLSIAQIPYSEGLKNAIQWMMLEEEETRPDFVVIRQWLCPNDLASAAASENNPSPVRSEQNYDEKDKSHSVEMAEVQKEPIRERSESRIIIRNSYGRERSGITSICGCERCLLM